MKKQNKTKQNKQNRTNLVDKGFQNKLFLRNKARNPERPRYGYPAHSGSQSHRRIWFTLSTHGASHIRRSTFFRFCGVFTFYFSLDIFASSWRGQFAKTTGNLSKRRPDDADADAENDAWSKMNLYFKGEIRDCLYLFSTPMALKTCSSNEQ